jgi:hypothetical protein
MRRPMTVKELYELVASGLELNQIHEIDAHRANHDRLWLTAQDVRFLRSCGVRADPENALAGIEALAETEPVSAPAGTSK